MSWSAEIFSAVISGIQTGKDATVAGRFRLNANYPNPFNPETIIPFELAKKGRVRLEIFNNLGEKVRTLVNGQLESGNHEVRWDGLGTDGRKLSSGVYFYKLQSGSFTAVQKMLLIK